MFHPALISLWLQRVKLSEALRTLFEKLIDAQAKMDIESRAPPLPASRWMECVPHRGLSINYVNYCLDGFVVAVQPRHQLRFTLAIPYYEKVSSASVHRCFFGR